MKTLTARSTLCLAAASALFAGTAVAGEVVIHKQPNFTGGAITLKNDTSNLAASGFQDQASSIEVKSGRWQFCSQPDFNGDCVTLERGKYATLDQKLNHRIESARELPVVAEKRVPPVVEERAYARRSYEAERYARQRELDERHAREQEREDLYARDRYRDRDYRVPERYEEDRYSYPGSRW
jgi:hypothetical protein